MEQLRNLFAAIAPGGSYFCVTPSRLNGPHDVSKYFDTVARGFHLKEYTVTELEQLFRGVGFKRIQAYTDRPRAQPAAAAGTGEDDRGGVRKNARELAPQARHDAVHSSRLVGGRARDQVTRGKALSAARPRLRGRRLPTLRSPHRRPRGRSSWVSARCRAACSSTYSISCWPMLIDVAVAQACAGARVCRESRCRWCC